MSYDLSVSEDFFLAEGEPYDRADLPLNSEGKPVSVWSALKSASPEEWADLAYNVFDCEPEDLQPETVLDKIRETNTCSNLDSPCYVWVDSEGQFTVQVYDNDI